MSFILNEVKKCADVADAKQNQRQKRRKSECKKLEKDLYSILF